MMIISLTPASLPLPSCARLFHAADLFVCHLLHLFEGALLFVFADLLFLGQLLEGVVAVAADVADGGAMLSARG